MAAFEQGEGDGAEAGTDLDQCLSQARRDRRKDLLDHARVVQEVLAEALARAVLHQPCRAIPTAAASAASRLPGSARPVPASSRAVPWSTELRTMGRPSVMFT